MVQYTMRCTNVKTCGMNYIGSTVQIGFTRDSTTLPAVACPGLPFANLHKLFFHDSGEKLPRKQKSTTPKLTELLKYEFQSERAQSILNAENL